MKTNAHKHILFYSVLTIYATFNIAPLIWMAINSLKTNYEYSMNVFSFPQIPQWVNYSTAWKTANLGSYFSNSVLITFCAVILTVFFAEMASYFLARFEFRGRKKIHSFFLLGMLIPVHATLVPLFLMMQKMHLLNTRLSLILVYTAVHIPITIYILVGFMKGFPNEIEEAASIDGSSIFETFFRIIMPMSKPALATVFILNFLYNWNEYLLSLVLISKKAYYTIPIGLTAFSDTETSFPTLQMAALVIVLIPTLVFFLSMQDYLVKGMIAGAVKE